MQVIPECCNDLFRSIVTNCLPRTTRVFKTPTQCHPIMTSSGIELLVLVKCSCRSNHEYNRLECQNSYCNNLRAEDKPHRAVVANANSVFIEHESVVNIAIFGLAVTR